MAVNEEDENDAFKESPDLDMYPLSKEKEWWSRI